MSKASGFESQINRLLVENNGEVAISSLIGYNGVEEDFPTLSTKLANLESESIEFDGDKNVIRSKDLAEQSRDLEDAVVVSSYDELSIESIFSRMDDSYSGDENITQYVNDYLEGRVFVVEGTSEVLNLAFGEFVDIDWDGMFLNPGKGRSNYFIRDESYDQESYALVADTGKTDPASTMTIGEVLDSEDYVEEYFEDSDNISPNILPFDQNRRDILRKTTE